MYNPIKINSDTIDNNLTSPSIVLHGLAEIEGEDLLSMQNLCETEEIDRYFELKLNTALAGHTTHEYQSKCMESPTIPHKIHFIWISDYHQPKGAPASHLAIVKSSLEIFRSQTNYTDWQYFFHTNVPDKISDTIAFFREQECTVIDIRNEYKNFLTRDFLEIFVAHKKWGFAIDLARFEILNHEGGIYLDLNFALKRALDHEICAYSFMNFDTHFMSQDGYAPFNFLNAILGPESYFYMARSHHPVLEHTINFYFDAFNGNHSLFYYQQLNQTNAALTVDLMFSVFSSYNILYLNPNQEPGIIYHLPQPSMERTSFCKARNLSDNTTHTLKINKFEDLLANLPISLVCTNPDIVGAIGYDDSSEGNSWVNET